VLGREPARATARTMRWPATRGRQKSRVGLGLVARSSGESGLRGRQRSGALVGGPVAASRRQGVPWEHQWGPGLVPGNAAVDGAHPRSGLTVGGEGGESVGSLAF
jgi:hypothetical protein